MGLLNIRKQERPRLNRFSVLFFGDSGVGKTGQSAKFPQALILDCEGNTDFLSGVAIQEVASAGQFLPLAREIAAGWTRRSCAGIRIMCRRCESCETRPAWICRWRLPAVRWPGNTG